MIFGKGGPAHHSDVPVIHVKLTPKIIGAIEGVAVPHVNVFPGIPHRRRGAFSKIGGGVRYIKYAHFTICLTGVQPVHRLTSRYRNLAVFLVENHHRLIRPAHIQ